MSEDCQIHLPPEPPDPQPSEPDPEPEAPGATDYSKALARVRACVQHRVQRVQEEAQDAEQRVRELLKQPHARREWMVLNSSRYRSWFICDRILDQSSQTSFDNPREGLELAQLALQMTEELEPELHGAGPIGDLRSSAIAQAGNCFRLMGRRKEASNCLGLARRNSEAGSGDQLLSARILSLEALLLVDEGRVGEALHRLDQALRLHSRAGDEAGVGRILAIRGSLFLRCGDPNGAAWTLRRAERRIDAEKDPHLDLKVRQDLVACSLALGDFPQAELQLQAAKARLEKLPEGPTGRCASWFRSALETGLGAEETGKLRDREHGTPAFWS